MIPAIATNLNTLRTSGPEAQGLSPMSADSARFAKTLNTLLMDDESTQPSANTDAVKAAVNVNDMRMGKPTEKEPTQPLHEVDARIDVISKARLTSQGELEQKAHELVGTTFYATLLKQMHDSPFKSELFSGGRGGEAFGGMYDQVLSQRMSQRGADKLVRPIIKKFEKAAKDAYDRQNQDKQKSPNEAKSDVPSNLRA